MRIAVVAHRRTETNAALAAAAGGSLLSPRQALLALAAGDVALARLDVRDELDGIEPGLETLDRLEAGGVLVLNRSAALVAAHDKLLTARALRRAGLPHPWTMLLAPAAAPPAGLDFPLVLKPRFGSWGRDVALCRDAEELRRVLSGFAFRPWFRVHGALLQELVPPLGHDLRLVVAGGSVVGAARREAAPGEWRTNVALGGTSSPAAPPRRQRRARARPPGRRCPRRIRLPPSGRPISRPPKPESPARSGGGTPTKAGTTTSSSRRRAEAPSRASGASIRCSRR